jgi:hypothetical protein
MILKKLLFSWRKADKGLDAPFPAGVTEITSQIAAMKDSGTIYYVSIFLLFDLI